MIKKIKSFILWFILVFALCLVLFSCKDRDDEQNSHGIHPRVSININEYSVVVKKRLTPQLEIKVLLKNTGDVNLKTLSFRCEAVSKSGQKADVYFYLNDLLISPGQELEKTIISLGFYWKELTDVLNESLSLGVTLSDEEFEKMYNENLETVTLIESSVICI